MKICLDARWIFPALSGVGIYTRELIRAWAADPGGHTFILLFNDDEVLRRTAEDTGFAACPAMRVERFPHGVFSAASQLRLPGLLRRLRPDWFFSPNWMIPLLPGSRTRLAVTLHDLIPIVLRDHAPHSRKARLFPLYLGLMRHIARRADLVFTVSEASRRDIHAHLLLASRPGRVRAIHNGVVPCFQPGDAPRSRTLLYVGRFDPYKNVPGLVEAFALARPNLPPGTRLRLVGAPDPRYPQARQTAERLGVSEALDWDEHLDGQGLRLAYQTASALVLASRYVGFGLPVVEAMACGTPVIGSDTPALAEIIGDAGLQVPAGDAPALAAAMVRMMTDEGLRADFSRRGLQRARDFTWAASAAAHLRALAESSDS